MRFTPLSINRDDKDEKVRAGVTKGASGHHEEASNLTFFASKPYHGVFRKRHRLLSIGKEVKEEHETGNSSGI